MANNTNETSQEGKVCPNCEEGVLEVIKSTTKKHLGGRAVVTTTLACSLRPTCKYIIEERKEIKYK